MHVLVTADTIGGVWTYARELVTGLVRRGVQVTLVSLGEIPTARQAEWIEGLRGVDFRPTAFRLEWMQDSRDDMHASGEYLLGIIKEVKPDLLHFNQYCYGALSTSVPRIVVAHSDVVSWSAAVHGQEPRDTQWNRWYRDTVASGISHASAIVAPSRWMLEAISAYYTRPQQASVIYNGRNPGLFNPHATKEDFVVSVGRLWDLGKQTLLLTQCELPVPLHIAGEDRHPDPVFQNNGGKWKSNGRIRFAGRLSEGDLRQLYSRASMYAATSRYEPFGLAPLEAAFSRCAIIANDIPTFHELWGDTACYFRYNDAASLERAIERLNSDRELRLTYANLAYHHARQHFTTDRMVDGYMDLYQSLVPAEAAAA
jgi:glycosyltransferase involved in cell wall biosynthesis